MISLKAFDKRKIRDYIRLVGALICLFIYIPHFMVYFRKKVKNTVDSDVIATKTDTLNLQGWIGVLYLLHNDRWFRRLFYYRIGPIAALLISWIRPGDKTFIISYQTKIGDSLCIAHPYSTVINAESIGSNFSCIHCTTIGKTTKGRPIIGNNVTLGATVTIIGAVKSGDNVTIGAGSVVVSDIPDNCIAVGNPCKLIKYK